MIHELKDMKIELMVSIWPTVDKESENYKEMVEKGLLIRHDRGIRTSMEGQGNPVHFDATKPAARSFVWNKIKANYYSKGVRVFWLDEAEPECKHFKIPRLCLWLTLIQTRYTISIFIATIEEAICRLEIFTP